MLSNTIKLRPKEPQEYIDDHQLIAQVKIRDFLYQLKHPDYRNLPRRNDAWAEIAKVMSIRDPRSVALRWKAVREKFAVKYRKQYFDNIEPSWPLFEVCRFLVPYVNLVSTRKPVKESEFEQIKVQPPAQVCRFDESQMIEHIRQRPVIFNQNHENFKVKSERLKAWKEIAKLTGWDSDFMQKRWRAMRDRFVRELRKSNSSNNSNMSSNFAQMMFLVPHIKSKNYSVEAEFDEFVHEDDGTFGLRNENFDLTSNESFHTSEVVEEEEVEHEVVQQENVEEYDENNSYELYEDAQVAEELHEEHNIITTADEAEYSENDEYQEEKVVFEDDEEYLSSVAYERDEEMHNDESDHITEEVSPISRKRKIPSEHEEDERCVKITSNVKIENEMQRTVAVTDMNMTLSDEDLAFGQTIGLMLKKIPNKLKTAIKLKIFQCLDDFELQHNLK